MHTCSAVVGSSPVPAPRSKRARLRSRSAAAQKRHSAAAKAGANGAEIRAKIAANRAKRLAIAEAMKREAGVTEHTVHHEDLSGLAYIGTGQILSPQGRKIVELCTLAHECGHIFLHNAGAGYWLAGHIKELEAESYMHQAFREHGMRVPRWRTQSGRQYIAWWIAKDRANGVAIDPRAEAYAWGGRSPFEPLRMVPSTWQTFHPAGPRPVRAPSRGLGSRLVSEARAVGRLAWWSLVSGYVASLFLFTPMMRKRYPVLPAELFPPDTGIYHRQLPELVAALCGGLLIANIAVLLRTLRR